MPHTWARAVIAHDYDGDRHLVALTDDVAGWEVVVTRHDGRREIVEPEPARSFHYRPELHGRPSWFVDHDLGRASWELRIRGELVSELRGDGRENPDADHSWADARIRELAVEWRDLPTRPRVPEGVRAHWAELVEWWVTSKEVPIPVRAGRAKRGSVASIRGLQVVYTDNAPAQWVFARTAFERWTPTQDQLAHAVSHEMPVAFALSQEERATAALTTTLGQSVSTQALGYRLCHKERVASGARSVAKMRVADLRDRARRLVDPANMFVIPKALGGLGEIDTFIEVMRTEDVTCDGSMTPPGRPADGRPGS